MQDMYTVCVCSGVGCECVQVYKYVCPQVRNYMHDVTNILMTSCMVWAPWSVTWAPWTCAFVGCECVQEPARSVLLKVLDNLEHFDHKMDGLDSDLDEIQDSNFVCNCSSKRSTSVSEVW